MADQYANCITNDQQHDRKTSKVYINPNFHRPSATALSSSMHFNPSFSHVIPNLYPNVQEYKDSNTKTRIHVNPNFIHHTESSIPLISNNQVHRPLKPPNSVPTSVSSVLDIKNQNQAPPMQVKSRYTLVRLKENVITKAPIVKPMSTTVRVNKYKSISLNVAKTNLAFVKCINTELPISQHMYKTTDKQTQAPFNRSRFKFDRSNSTSVTANQYLTEYASVRRTSFLNKSIPKSETRKIINKLVLKKNNIPCPLFKKFGQCLRMLHGKCECLHDKKLVSICRKFLKGICHDTNCLLSHDLTKKKMPTCYFYLKGACTKEKCPYLHVKLNDKAKICLDFLKGYCEKGDKCLFRHINVQNKSLKEACSKKQSLCSPASKIILVSKMKTRKKILVPPSREHRHVRNEVNSPPTQEQRYYKESIKNQSSGEISDVIKPSRVKLGTLPSYIQL